MQMGLSNEQLSVALMLNEAGKQCYISGGAIRDTLMGEIPRDIDYNTDATPIEMIKIFHNKGWKLIPSVIQKLADQGKYKEASEVKEFGLEFGVLRIKHPLGKEDYEVTTFRKELEYEGRKPVKMTFEKSVRRDLARRDITINSIAYDPLTGELVDPYNGREDIKNGIIRAVGDPAERIKEDPLRMMRIARFSARWGFKIEESLSIAMFNHAQYINVVKKERIAQELLKMMKQAKMPSFGIIVLSTHRIMDYIIPQLLYGRGIPQPPKFHKHDVYDHSLVSMDFVSRDKPFLRLVALLHDIAKPPIYKMNAERIEKDIANSEKTFPWFKEHEKIGAEMVRKILRKLKFSNKDSDRASHLVLHHMRISSYRVALAGNSTDAKVRKFIRKILADKYDNSILEDLFTLNRADVFGSGTQKDNKSFELIDEFERLVNIQLEEMAKTPIIIPVNGYDIMNDLGVKPSPLVSEIKEFVTSLYLEDLSLTKESLLSEAKIKFNI